LVSRFTQLYADITAGPPPVELLILTPEQVEEKKTVFGYHLNLLRRSKIDESKIEEMKSKIHIHER
jgi:hypothetical protein